MVSELYLNSFFFPEEQFTLEFELRNKLELTSCLMAFVWPGSRAGRCGQPTRPPCSAVITEKFTRSLACLISLEATMAEPGSFYCPCKYALRLSNSAQSQ